MRKTLTFNCLDLISTLVFFSCINIPYIDIKIPWLPNVLSLLRIFLIFCFMILLIKKKSLNFSKFFLLFNLMYLLLILTSMYYSRNLFYVFNTLSKSYLIVLFIELYLFNNDKILIILRRWKKLLLVLCILDFISILMYPNGLYVEKNYTLNWFLGYKTARMNYSFPLMYISTYIHIFTRENKRINLYGIHTLCILTSFLSQATAATVALVTYSILLLLGLKTKFLNSKKTTYRFFNPNLLIIEFGILHAFILFVETNKFIQYIVLNIFHKSTTLSNRTIIWENCIKYFLENPIFGNGMLTPLEYINISGYFLGTSAHNYLITLLVDGGIVVVVILYFMFIETMARRRRIYNDKEITLIFSVISFMVLGLTSSTLVFATFSFLPFMLLENEKYLAKK